MNDHFNIGECALAGCINCKHSKCALDKRPIQPFAEIMQFWQDSKVCLVRKQINLHRTNELIENK